jgi:NADPH:quinone reductase-like Zn-dependent oxidoreductase
VGAGEVKVKVVAAGLNPVDWKLRSGALQAMMPLRLPAVLGRDVSGTVLEVGSGVTRFKPGDRVLGLVNGGYAEQVVASEQAFAPLPDGLDLRDAAALPLVLLTGAQLIEDATRPAKGERVLVTGAVGGVGRAAVHAAKKLGARPIAGVRAAQKSEAQQLGAAQVDAIADTVGGETVAKLIPRIRKGGALGSVVGEPPAAKGRDLRVRAFMAHADPTRLRALAEDVARGELTIPVARRLPLGQAREAQKLAERGGTGKLLLLP